MSFVNATYLFGLLGFIIPIAIHLWNKKEAKVIKVGSIQFVPNQDSNQSRSLQLNEVLLLLLRCLLLGLISFLMAGLMIEEKSISKDVVLIDPELINDKRVQDALDTMSDKYEIRLLSEKIPVYEQDNELSVKPQGLWTLTNDINKLNTDSVVVFTSQTISSTKGRRPEIDKPLSMVTIDPIEPLEYLAAAFQLTDQYVLFYGVSDGISTTYTRQLVSELPASIENNNGSLGLKGQNEQVILRKLDTLNVGILYEDQFLKDKTILEASIRAISEFTGFPIQLFSTRDTEKTKNSDWLLWFSNKELVTSSAKTISLEEDEFKELLYEGDMPGQYHLNSRLNYNNVLANDLSKHLMELFYEFPADNNDQRAIATSQLAPLKNTEAKTLHVQSKASSQYWLWVIFATTLIFERFVSMKKEL